VTPVQGYPDLAAIKTLESFNSSLSLNNSSFSIMIHFIIIIRDFSVRSSRVNLAKPFLDHLLPDLMLDVEQLSVIRGMARKLQILKIKGKNQVFTTLGS